MFTGIIETVGTVVSIKPRGNYRLLKLKPGHPFEELAVGESISVDGCCLTVTEFDKTAFAVEASQETAGLSIIKSYKTGTRVNLERALKPSGRLGGHFVTGHIDCTGKVHEVKGVGESLELAVRFPEEYAEFLVAKGSVAVNGISLTVNRVEGDVFDVNLIPFTREWTTVDGLTEGDHVNLEFDILGKYVVKLLDKKKKNGLTIDKLIESGW
jgi:riboflavin synthase